MLINLKLKDDNHKSIDINIFTNQIIEKITKNLENFHYNVLIANLHEIYNYLSKNLKKFKDKKNLLSNYEKILKVILPVMPHLMNECLDELKVKDKNEWPKVNKKYLKNENFNVVIQINGKKRGLMNFNKEISEKDLLFEIKNDKKISKFLKDKGIKKSIYIKNKLINLII